MVGTFRVIAGLGNPGPKYERTRHNVGFMFVDALTEPFVLRSGWQESDGCAVCNWEIATERVHGVKPLTFMNRSGEPLQRFLSFYKVPLAELVVVHDDVDLPFGTVRLKRGGGEGGHNGLRSISTMLGSPDYVRLRLGVGRPADDPVAPERIEAGISDWVLGRFSPDESSQLGQVFDRAKVALEELFRHGLDSAQNKFN